MRLQTQAQEVSRHNISAPASYANIEMNATAFEVLSSSIYTDKPLAIVRELCANALDSHRAAGQDLPFEVHLPNPLSPELIITDYGLGLSPTQVRELYMTYFGSTKRDTNEMIGGFGLGSKSPLAYTDSFVVSSTWNGRRTAYAVFRDETGVPAIQQLGSERVNAHNGVTIRVPVRRPDFQSFVRAAAAVLPYFPAGSVQCPSHPELVVPITYSPRAELWGVRTSGAAFGLRAVMGHVAYVVPTSSLDWRESLHQLSSKPYDLFFEVGELSLSVSREQLQMDDRTLAKLRARVELMMEELASAFLSAAEAAPNAYSKLLIYSQAADTLPTYGDELHHAYLRDFVSRSPFADFHFGKIDIPREGRSKGVPTLHPDHEAFRGMWGGSFRPSTTLAEMHANAQRQTPDRPEPYFIFLDVPLKLSARKLIQANPDLLPIVQDSPYGLVMVHGGSYQDFVSKVHPNCIPLSDLNLRDPSKSRRRAKPRTEKPAGQSLPSKRDVWAARHYRGVQTTNGGTLRTYRVEVDLDPTERYVFSTFYRINALLSSHPKQVRALLDNPAFSETVLGGAKLFLVSENPPAYIQHHIDQYPQLHEKLYELGSALAQDADYQRARRAITRYEAAMREFKLPTMSPFALDRLPRDLSSFAPQLHRAKRLAYLKDELARRIRRLRETYHLHLTFDTSPLPELRPARFPEFFAAFYERHPLTTLIAANDLSLTALKRCSSYTLETDVVSISALYHLLNQEA